MASKQDSYGGTGQRLRKRKQEMDESAESNDYEGARPDKAFVNAETRAEEKDRELEEIRKVQDEEEKKTRPERRSKEYGDDVNKSLKKSYKRYPNARD